MAILPVEVVRRLSFSRLSFPRGEYEIWGCYGGRRCGVADPVRPLRRPRACSRPHGRVRRSTFGDGHTEPGHDRADEPRSAAACAGPGTGSEAGSEAGPEADPKAGAGAEADTDTRPTSPKPGTRERAELHATVDNLRPAVEPRRQDQAATLSGK